MEPGRKSTPSQRLWRISTFVFVLAFLAQVPAWWQYSRDPYSRTLVSDALSYEQWASRLARDGLSREPVFHQAPLFPFAVSGIYRAFPPALQRHACVAFGVACTSFAVATLVWIGALFFGACAPGVLAAGVVLLHGPFAFHGLKLLPVPLALATQAGALAALGAARQRPTLLTAGLAGLGLGIGALARAEVLLFAPFAAAAVAFPDVSRTRAVRAVLVLAFTVGLAAGIAPATVHNLRRGDFVLVASSGGENLYIGNRKGARGDYSPIHPKAGDIFSERILARELAEQEAGRALSAQEVSAYWRRKAVAAILADPPGWLRLLGLKLARVADPGDPTDIYSFPLERSLYLTALFLFPLPAWFLLLSGSAGVVLSLRRMAQRTWPLAAFALAQLMVLLLFFVNTRLRLPLMFSLAPFAGLAMWEGARAWRASRRRASWAIAALALLGASAVGAALTKPQPRDLVRLASVLSTQERLEEGLRVLEPALSSSPPYAPALDEAGWLLQKKGEWAGAGEMYVRALAAGMPAGRGVATRTRLAIALERSGDPAGAAAQHSAAVADADADAGTHYERAMFLLRRGEREAALRDLKEATRLDPAWPPPREALRGLAIE